MVYYRNTLYKTPEVQGYFQSITSAISDILHSFNLGEIEIDKKFDCSHFIGHPNDTNVSLAKAVEIMQVRRSFLTLDMGNLDEVLAQYSTFEAVFGLLSARANKSERLQELQARYEVSKSKLIRFVEDYLRDKDIEAYYAILSWVLDESPKKDARLFPYRLYLSNQIGRYSSKTPIEVLTYMTRRLITSLTLTLKKEGSYYTNMIEIEGLSSKSSIITYLEVSLNTENGDIVFFGRQITGNSPSIQPLILLKLLILNEEKPTKQPDIAIALGHPWHGSKADTSTREIIKKVKYDLVQLLGCGDSELTKLASQSIKSSKGYQLVPVTTK